MSSTTIQTQANGAPAANLLKALLAPQAPPPAPPGGPTDSDLLARVQDGYDSAAADAQAEALCADANRKVINPLLKLLRAYRLAVALVLLPAASATLACMLPLGANDEKAAAGFALATTLAPIAAYLIVRLNFLAIHEADYERELLFRLDLGAERRTSAAEFMTLDPDACRHGLQDFAGRTRALISLTRRLDKSSALLAKDVRYLYRAVIALAALLAIGAVVMLGWRAAHHGDWTAIGVATGALGAAALVLTLVLWSARKHIAELLHLLAPPTDSGDAFVVICARILGLLGEVIAQNEFLRRA